MGAAILAFSAERAKIRDKKLRRYRSAQSMTDLMFLRDGKTFPAISAKFFWTTGNNDFKRQSD
ncbi:unnamed protein product [Ixodes pacificus]